MIFELFKYLFSLILSLNIAYFIGLVIIKTLSLETKNSWFSSTLFIVIGLLFLSTISSIIVTKFQTCFVLIPLLFGFQMFLTNKKTEIQNIHKTFENFDYKKFMTLNVIGILSFFFFFNRIETLDIVNTKLLTYDTFNWAQMSKLFFEYKNESVLINGLDFDAGIDKAPYHYFDIWLNGTISYVFNLNTSYCMAIVTYPLLVTAAIVSFVSLIYEFSKKFKLIDISLGLFILILSSGIILIPKDLELLFNKGNNILNQPFLGLYWGKIYVIYIFVSLSIIFLNRKNLVSFTNSLLILLILYSQVIVGIGGLLAYLFFSFLISKSNKKLYLSLLICSSVFYVIFVIYYFNPLFIDKKIGNLQHIEGLVISLKLYFILVAEKTLLIVFSYWIFILSCFYLFFKKEKNNLKLFIPYFIIILVSLIFWIVNINTKDMWQVFLIWALPIFNIFQSVLIITTLNNQNFKLKYITYTILCFYFFINHIKTSSFTNESELGIIDGKFYHKEIYPSEFKSRIINSNRFKDFENLLVISDYNCVTGAYFGNMPGRFLYYTNEFKNLYWIDLDINLKKNVIIQPQYSNQSLRKLISESKNENPNTIITKILKGKRIDAILDCSRNKLTYQDVTTKYRDSNYKFNYLYDDMLQKRNDIELVAEDYLSNDKFYFVK